MQTPLKICFFSSTGSLDTGMPICTYRLISWFSTRAEYDVHAVFPAQGDFVNKLTDKNVKISILPFQRLRSIRFLGSFIRFWLQWPFVSYRFFRYVRDNKIQLVHFSDFIDAPFYIAAKLSGAKVIAHFRYVLEKPIHRVLFYLLTKACADRVICISKAVLRCGGLDAKKTVVILDPGPDYSFFNPENTYHLHSQLSTHKMHVVMIANFRYVKGHDLFVRIAARVESMIQNSVQFCIVGDTMQGHEQYYKKVIKLTKELGVDRCVEFLGGIPNEQIPAILAHTHIFVHVPRYQEGLGMVITEAMAMRVPVVAFDSGGVAECFRDGREGFLIPQNDIDTAAKKIVQLVHASLLREQMGQSAYVHVREIFSIERHGKAVEEVYRIVLKKM
jgi:glycosyltransferase involved in cell wall biosynthesis